MVGLMVGLVVGLVVGQIDGLTADLAYVWLLARNKDLRGVARI